MSVQVKGLKELIDYYDKVSNVKSVKKAVREGGKVILDVEKKVAADTHKKYATGRAVTQLKLSSLRTKQKRAFIDAGIKNGKSDWNAVKGLYYNHYGFYHSGWHHTNTRKKRLAGDGQGHYITGSRWMDDAFDKSISQAYDKVEQILLEELNK